MDDRTLNLALWISLTLHLLALVLLPDPTKVRAEQPIALEVEWLIESVESLPADLEEVTETQQAPPAVPKPWQEEIEPDSSAIEESAVQQAPIPSPLEQPPPQETTTPPVDTQSTESIDPLPETDSGAEEDLESPPPPDLERIEELLRTTRIQVDARRGTERYRMLEVRERVLRALQEIHPGSRVVARDATSFRCLMSFSVDDEGYIFDLGLRFPPGSALDARTIEGAIISLSPLSPPPPEVSTPLSIEWQIDFLD